MIFINEWLPNPVGVDTKGEFIELFNNGKTPIDLTGWSLIIKNGKHFLLSGHYLSAGSYLILPRAETKLTLKNADEQLSLYSANGTLIDQSNFSGAAPDGQSFNRINYGSDESQHFAFGVLTPGRANDNSLQISLVADHYPLGVPINQTSISIIQCIFLLIGTAALIAGLIMYTIKQDENASNLFFERD